MRIAQVCPSYHPKVGGIESVVKGMSQNLVKKGHEVEVLVSDCLDGQPKETVINGVLVRRFSSLAPNNSFYYSHSLYRYLKQNSKNYDIIHSHAYQAFPALYAALSKSDNKLVFQPHLHQGGKSWLNTFLHIPYRLLGRTSFVRSDAIVCGSKYERHLVNQGFAVPAGKILVIPPGIDREQIKAIPEVQKDEGLILCVARLEKYKGIQYLIKAFSKVDRHKRLEIIGTGTYQNKIYQMISRMDLVSRVKIYQNLSQMDLYRRYVRAGLFVLLSKYESYGVSVAEALAAKTPCIVANCSALGEWVDNRNCFGINYPIDVSALARMIEEVIGTRVPNLEFPNWKEVTDVYESLYKSCLHMQNLSTNVAPVWKHC